MHSVYSDTEFVDFNDAGCAAIGVTDITGKCSFGCGGWTYKFEGESQGLSAVINMFEGFYMMTLLVC